MGTPTVQLSGFRQVKDKWLSAIVVAVSDYVLLRMDYVLLRMYYVLLRMDYVLLRLMRAVVMVNDLKGCKIANL